MKDLKKNEELPQMNELSGEMLEFSELSGITGGTKEKENVGCSWFAQGKCGQPVGPEEN